MKKPFILIFCLYCSLLDALVIQSKSTLDARAQLATELPFADVSGIGGGVPIHERWVLTAAHVALGLDAEKHNITINGSSLDIKKVYPHSEFKMTPTAIQHDIALIELVKAIPETTLPKNKYPVISSSNYEISSPVIIIGRGDLITLDDKTIEPNQSLLAATNAIHRLNKNNIIIQLNKNASTLEGMGAPGDSGGPLLYKQNKHWHLIGISSHDMTFGEESEHATYNDMDVYTRVSAYQHWIQRTMGM